MNNAELKETGLALIALSEGRKTQFKSVNTGQWIDDMEPSNSLRSGCVLRVKPLPKTRPWSQPDDVPGPVCWIRHENKSARMIVAIEPGVVWVACLCEGEASFKFSELSAFEYSTDRREWKKCEVVTEE